MDYIDKPVSYALFEGEIKHVLS